MFVHGWAGSFDRTWKRSGMVDLVTELGCVVLPYDLPGHGTSLNLSHEPVDYANLHDDLIRHIEAFTDRPVDMVAFSLGAITTLHALIARPELFGTVVLAGIGNGVFLPHDPQNTERILAGLQGRGAPGDVVARIFGKIGNEPPNDAVALAAVLRRPRQGPVTGEQLSRVPNEVVVTVGEQDFSAPADRLAAAFASGRLVTLPKVDHFRTPESFEFIDLVMETLGGASR